MVTYNNIDTGHIYRLETLEGPRADIVSGPTVCLNVPSAFDLSTSVRFRYSKYAHLFV